VVLRTCTFDHCPKNATPTTLKAFGNQECFSRAGALLPMRNHEK
jgi:hypothetical protein